ncbi:hypothetical protein PF005_g4690 [Phytophthora fragariae]|uniref:D-isomer specific 2-hydroxyacid dehydrogenase NAD-binding domain-containing protein n=1 Tax=Phytophthora fragariae TaxID=53985 RepID=A0A6A4CWJ0_9STRA|nr:hypothetical protein PF009_g2250 [Phytophthora fragariae]KAE8998596.1 hypothetical protein PF011_g14984 [Phytophthora fragariae]KAE9129654.1 hypothetical protein PF007_g4807 [Phytophthora fragariae]KAE9131062.1 hypothetical protein PF010_g3629 [Phytophthora fragariae]KAE9147227.1 hypothetical protein PF006_g8070 [Phytophthora fragariae]
MPAYKKDIAAIVNHVYDLENKHVGVVAASTRSLSSCNFTDKCSYLPIHLPADVEKELNVQRHPSVVKYCDVVSTNGPLHPETDNFFDAELLRKMQNSAYIVNTTRGMIVARDALVKVVESALLDKPVCLHTARSFTTEICDHMLSPFVSDTEESKYHDHAEL